MKNKDKKTSRKGLVLAGALAAGAAAAGYYFYKSEGAAKNRQNAAAWAKKLKQDVLSAARKAEKTDRKTLEGIIGSAAKAYQEIKGVDHGELARAARELKVNWQNVAKEIGKSVSATKKTVKKAAKRVAKRARA